MVCAAADSGARSRRVQAGAPNGRQWGHMSFDGYWPTAARELSVSGGNSLTLFRHRAISIGYAPHCCRPAAPSEYRHTTQCSTSEPSKPDVAPCGLN